MSEAPGTMGKKGLKMCRTYIRLFQSHCYSSLRTGYLGLQARRCCRLGPGHPASALLPHAAFLLEATAAPPNQVVALPMVPSVWQSSSLTATRCTRPHYLSVESGTNKFVGADAGRLVANQACAVRHQLVGQQRHGRPPIAGSSGTAEYPARLKPFITSQEAVAPNEVRKTWLVH